MNTRFLSFFLGGAVLATYGVSLATSDPDAHRVEPPTPAVKDLLGYAPELGRPQEGSFIIPRNAAFLRGQTVPVDGARFELEPLEGTGFFVTQELLPAGGRISLSHWDEAVVARVSDFVDEEPPSRPRIAQARYEIERDSVPESGGCLRGSDPASDSTESLTIELDAASMDDFSSHAFITYAV